MDNVLILIEEHLNLLLKENETLRAELKMMQQANKTQREELMLANQHLSELKKQYDAVRTAYNLTADTEKKLQAKQQLTHLVQLVDKAIKAVNEAEYKDEAKHNYLYQ